MKRVDLDDLRAKAEACGGKATARVTHAPWYGQGQVIVMTERDGAVVYEFCTATDAEFAVAAQPSVVIALCDYIARLERGLRGCAEPVLIGKYATELAREILEEGATV